MALDIKSLHDDYYSELCNVENAVEGVLKTCEYAAKHYGIHIETRTCIVTGYNDNIQMLGGIAAWIRDHLGRDSVWHILQYLPKHQLRSVPKTSKAVLEAARMEGIRAGLEVVHVVEGKGCD
jgi:pyruvate-formate lyase-activating enzyme